MKSYQFLIIINVLAICHCKSNVVVSDVLLKQLRQITNDMDEVFAHSIVSKGVNSDGETFEVQNNSRALLNARASEFDEAKDNHEVQPAPPFIGSYCNSEDYNSLIRPYYKVPFVQQDQRLSVNKGIRERFEELGDEYAWSLCQYGGLKLECSTKSRCVCQAEAPPDNYLEFNSTCVGGPGAQCTENPAAPITCDEGLECSEGYCGGIDKIAKLLSSARSIHLPNWMAILTAIWYLATF